MGMFPSLPRTYEDGRTKQAFKDETDIQKILQRAQQIGTLSHLEKHGASYGDFEAFDFTEAMQQLARAKSIFEELPSELRREFNHDPRQFFTFVNNPDNADRLPDLLPALARPGRQFPAGPQFGTAPEPQVPDPASPPLGDPPGPPSPPPGGGPGDGKPVEPT